MADDLYDSVRVVCWVMTQPANHALKARTVKYTWGHRCNKVLFMSTTEDPSLPTVALPVREGREHLWDKTKAAFQYIYDNHLDDGEWFMKADDDTFVIVENLRYFLSAKNYSAAEYYGCRFKPFSKEGYMSGGMHIF